MTGSREGGRLASPLGLHRVLKPGGVLPQAAWRLDSGPAIWPDEVRIRVDRLNLDAASYRQLRESTGGSAEAMRGAVLQIVADRGKMQNPVTGSGGMLTGVVDEAGPASYSDVQFRAPVRAGDVIEATGTVIRTGRRSRQLAFEARVVCRADPARGPSAAAVLDEPIVVVTATGTVVVPVAVT